MSHISTVKTELKDPAVLAAACERLGLSEPQQGSHRLFSGAAIGLGIKLPGWNYPVVIQDDGTVKFDNYNGAWGDEARLDELKQAYTVEAARSLARRRGLTVTETKLDDGAIKLSIRGMQ